MFIVEFVIPGVWLSYFRSLRSKCSRYYGSTQNFS